MKLDNTDSISAVINVAKCIQALIQPPTSWSRDTFLVRYTVIRYKVMFLCGSISISVSNSISISISRYTNPSSRQ